MMDGRVASVGVNCFVYTEGQWIPRASLTQCNFLMELKGSGSCIYQPHQDKVSVSEKQDEASAGSLERLYWNRLKWMLLHCTLTLDPVEQSL